MKILVVDPGVFPGVGHNATMLEALDTETRSRADVRLVGAVAQEVDPALLGLHCEVLPVFRVHGYAKVQCGSDSPSALGERLTALFLEDLLALEPHTYDLLLMPTAYPFLLAALAAGIGHLPHTRIACGLLMPPRFWAGDAAALPLLENTVKHAVQRLNQHPNVFFHSERGVYPIGETTVASAALLPPAPEPTLQWMAALSANPWSTVPGGGAHAVRFGFFGEPTARKGFHHLSAAVHAGLPAGAALTVRLPAGCEALAAPMSTADGRIDARSETMSTPAFLDAMSQVDVVLVFYAPEFHREQMSGIVAEAICLGKPLLLANGCDALIDFLSTLAPGSFLCRPFGVAGLQHGLGTPPALWRALSHSAAASAPALRALKSASRYLTVSSGGAYAPARREGT